MLKKKTIIILGVFLILLVGGVFFLIKSNKIEVDNLDIKKGEEIMSYVKHNPDYVECLVKTSDSVVSKLDKSLWTDEQINEDIRTGTKRGYVLGCRYADWNGGNWSWGYREADLSHGFIVQVPIDTYEQYKDEITIPEYNESLPIKEYDQEYYDECILDCRNQNCIDKCNDEANVTIGYEIARERKWIFPLDLILNSTELEMLNNIEYNQLANITLIKTITDINGALKLNDLNSTYIDNVLHGSSGTFTICPSGCDYSDLSTWEANEQADLTGTGSSIANITEGFLDTGGVIIAGWTTTASDYIEIITAPAARHNGTWSSDKYILNSSNTYGLYILEDYVRIEGIQINVEHPSSGGNGIQLNGITASNSINLSYSILRSDLQSTGTGFGSLDPDSITYVYNNIISGWPSYGATGTNGVNHFYSNTFYKNARGFSAGATSTIAINNIVSNTTLAPDSNTIVGALNSSTCGYNSIDSADTDLGSNNSYSEQEFLYVSETAGAEDLHLQSIDTAAMDRGLTLDLFSDDIDGETRTGTWDIGADEYVAGADETPPYFTDISNQTINNITALNYDINATDETSFDSFAIDDETNFSIVASTGVITNNTQLAVGFYTVNVTINDSSNNLNSTLWGLNVTAYSPPADSCTYSSGDWVVDCSDNCIISSPVDLGGNNLILSGSGTVKFNADIDNVGNFISKNNCNWICSGGCFI